MSFAATPFTLKKLIALKEAYAKAHPAPDQSGLRNFVLRVTPQTLSELSHSIKREIHDGERIEGVLIEVIEP